jgi:hypothetical protein
MINAFFASANMSQFAYVSPIGGTSERFGLLVFKHRATNNREPLRIETCTLRSALAETDGAFKTNAEWPKGPAVTWRYGKPTIRTSQVCNVHQLTDV